MRRGLKSLLWGAHNFFLHPLTVYLSWVWLYHSLPTWREAICILIHDWGYWECETMDGKDGAAHPNWAANLVGHWNWREEHSLILLHSRHLAKDLNMDPSRLYYADKLSFALIPACIYVPMARMSGELQEYRIVCDRAKQVPIWYSDWQWHSIIRENMIKLSKDPKAVSYLYE